MKLINPEIFGYAVLLFMFTLTEKLLSAVKNLVGEFFRDTISSHFTFLIRVPNRSYSKHRDPFLAALSSLAILRDKYNVQLLIIVEYPSASAYIIIHYSYVFLT